MKNIIQIIFICLSIFILTACGGGQFNNEKNVTVKVYGNCEMCKKTIEKAGSNAGVSAVVWNVESKMATLRFDAAQTSADKILKQIAEAGYDSEQFTASDEAYNGLHSCCQYERAKNK